MSEFAALHASLVVGEFFAISSLVMVLAWLGGFGKVASHRHLIWAAAFGALILLPLLVALVPGSIVLSLAAPAPVSAVDISAAPAAAPESFHIDTATIIYVSLAMWLAGVAAIALRGLAAAIILRGLRRHSVENPFEASELPQVARRGGFDLRVSHEEQGPVTWGYFRPVILLPQRALYWPGERLQAVLLHELAHVRRGDSAMQMFSLVACALYWPNPLVWLGAAAMRREAEMATDDAVLVSGLTPSDYAGELLQIAAEIRARPLSPFTPMHMAAPSALEARVQSVLAPSQRRTGVTKMDVLKIAAVALLATTVLVAARPSLAQDATPVEAAPLAPVAPSVEPVPPAPAVEADAPAQPAPVAEPAPVVEASAPVAAARQSHSVQVYSTTHRVHGRNVTRNRVIVDGVVRKDWSSDPQISRDIAEATANAQIWRAQASVQAQAAARMSEAMKNAEPQIQAAMAQARAEMAKANMNLRVQERVDAAMQRAELRIEMRRADDHSRDVRVEQDDETDGN